MKTAIRQVEDLNVFQRSYSISLTLHEISLRFPKHEQYHGVGDQIRRASKGICANLAEGFGKQHISTAEFKRYLSMAIGSADETRLWLSYARDLNYLEEQIADNYRNEYQEIAKMLSGLHKSWK